jgi:Ca2+-binding EF-hand superfamily protein
MEARAAVEVKREKRRRAQSRQDAAAAEIQRIARGKRERTRVEELKKKRKSEWYHYVEWDVAAHNAAVRIQSLYRGKSARKKIPVVPPFQFAVGGYIFQHPGRKRPSEDAKKALRSGGARTAQKHIDLMTEMHLHGCVESVSPDALAKAKTVPEGPGSDVNLMFDMFDINSDGFISVNDLKHVWGALEGPRLPQHTHMADMLEAGDTDGDGLLSKAEFEDYMREVNKFMNDDEQQEEQAKEKQKAKAKMTGSEKRDMMLKRLRGELTPQEITDAGLTTGKTKKSGKKKK